MSNKFFGEIKKNFGFGCMRFPMKDDVVDTEELSKMVDYFIENGFNYFDTAKPYIGGQSEPALKTCLVDRYPRDAYILVDKLTSSQFEKEEEILPLFELQLERCGVDYFDFYLMHSQNKAFFEKYKKTHAYEIAFDLKKQGKVKHVGISFHDSADVLEDILTTYPEIEVVQIQFNYIDYENKAIQARQCYEVCEKHGKPVIVMEPVKGGSLANLPEQAKKVFDDLGDGYSSASYAVRYAAGFDNIMMVLSGMSNLEQMMDNVQHMKEFKPLDEREMEAVRKVCEILDSYDTIPCTNCRYCVEGCPMNIRIPDLFADMNVKKSILGGNADWYYMIHTMSGGKASECVKCGACEKECPQHLNIRELLEQVAEAFEKKD